MARASSTVVVDRPAEAVFDFLADGTNNPRWRQGVIDIALASGDGVGAVYKQTLRGPGGRSMAGDYRVTEFARPSRLAFEVIAGPGRPTGSFDLAAVSATQTQVTFELELRPTGLMRLMAPMIARQVQQEVNALPELKRALEAG